METEKVSSVIDNARNEVDPRTAVNVGNLKNEFAKRK
jgi:hypothetical protein